MKQTKSSVRLLAEFLRGSTGFFVISILASMAVTFLEMVSPQIIRLTVDSVIGTDPVALPAVFARLFEALGGSEFFRTRLWLIALVLIGVALCSVLCEYLMTLFNSKGGETLLQTMRNRLFAHIQRLPFAWHMKNKTGDIIQRCTSDVDMIKNFMASQLTSVFRIVILIVFSLICMFTMNWKLSLIALCSIPVIVGYSTFFRMKISHYFQECDENEGILSTIAQENLTGVRVVRAFGRESYEKDRFERQNVIYTDLWMKLCKLLSYFWATGDLISGLQVLLVVVLGTVLCVNGELSVGSFVAFISYNSMLIWPVRQLGRMISEMSKAGVSLDRIRYIADSEEERDTADVTCPDMTGDIVFSHVNFGYEEGTEVLRDVSFTVRGGSTFAILGGTGSGKSTLMALLNRLYPLSAEQGTVTVSGVDINKIELSHLRRNVGMVLQEPFLFSRTIAENIAITQAEPNLDDIRGAADVACLDETVTEFAKGYDTMVGERGVTLSGGQKQRTAIARMLMQKTPVMVFDDSLSAVDAETDAKIRRALREKLGNSTVILISHRITTLMHADCIMVLDKGRVAEMGTHDQLLQKGGIYKHIYDLQTKGTEGIA